MAWDAFKYLGTPKLVHPSSESQLDHTVISQSENSPEIFTWFLVLRWVAVFGQLACILTVRYVFQVSILLVPLLCLVSLLAATNIVLTFIHQRIKSAEKKKQSYYVQRSTILVGVMAFDLLLLTSLLFYSGGPANPCSIFFMVNLCLGGVILSPKWAWMLQYLALGCFSFLLYDHHPIEVITQEVPLPSIKESGSLLITQFGFFMAFAMCSVVITYFTTLLTTSLRYREYELRQAAQWRARGEKLEALGTLAAGAAHELSSPLSTIAIVSKELQRDAEQEEISEVVQEDIRLIRSEVDRCRAILNRMSADAGHQTWEEKQIFSIKTLFETIAEDLQEKERVDFQMDAIAESYSIEGPLVILAQALRGIVKNGLEASEYNAACKIIPISDKSLKIEISDEGLGISDEILSRIGEPFFTTKPTGQGMGLGVFLARSVVERLSGQLTIESFPKEGTRVSILLPCVCATKTPQTA